MAANCPAVITKRVRLCTVGIGGVYFGEHGTDLFTTPPSSSGRLEPVASGWSRPRAVTCSQQNQPRILPPASIAWSVPDCCSLMQQLACLTEMNDGSVILSQRPSTARPCGERSQRERRGSKQVPA